MKEDLFHIIELYISGKMDAETLRDFEARLAAEPDLQAEVKLHRELQESVKGEGLHEFRDAVRSVDKTWTGEAAGSAKVVPLFRKTWVRIATLAATVLIFVLILQNLTGGSAVSGSDLFTEHFEPYQMVLSERNAGGDSSLNALLEHAISQYKSENYGGAAAAFQVLEAQQSGNIAFAFYAAVADLARGETPSAISSFQDILNREGHPFIEQCRYYLALSHLQDDDLESASKVLEVIEEGAFEYETAQSILRQIQE